MIEEISGDIVYNLLKQDIKVICVAFGLLEDIEKIAQVKVYDLQFTTPIQINILLENSQNKYYKVTTV